MGRSTFSGPVRSLRGFLGTGPAMNTGTIGAGTVDGGTNITGIDLYQGKVVQLANNTVIFNLPEIITTATPASAGADDPTSTNRVGLMYTFLLTANLSGQTFTLNAGSAAGRSTADVFQGTAMYVDTGDNSVEGFNAAGADTLTLDGSTRGGLGGSIVYCRAAADGIWLIDCALNGSGTMVTPWS
jgi:hypothetical protein